MSFNRIAVFGHRGWASSEIVKSLASAVPTLRVLHRPESDASNLPSNVTAISIDIENPQSISDALHDIDILISLVGHEGVKRQHNLVQAIPKTQVKLFVPSDLGFRCDEQGLGIAINRAKRDVEEAAKKLGIPTTIVWPGNLVESSLATTMLGIDVPGNRIVYTGDSDRYPLNLCTLAYVAASYASIFARTPPSELAGRTITLTELQPTGADLAAALAKKHSASGPPQQILQQSLPSVDAEISACVAAGNPLALGWYCRRVWGAGIYRPHQHGGALGDDVWTAEGWEKASLEDLLVRGRMGKYRDLPPFVTERFAEMFGKAEGR